VYTKGRVPHSVSGNEGQAIYLTSEAGALSTDPSEVVIGIISSGSVELLDFEVGMPKSYTEATYWNEADVVSAGDAMVQAPDDDLYLATLDNVLNGSNDRTFVGFAQVDGVANEDLPIYTGGSFVIDSLSAEQDGTNVYLSNTPGSVSTEPTTPVALLLGQMEGGKLNLLPNPRIVTFPYTEKTFTASGAITAGQAVMREPANDNVKVTSDAITTHIFTGIAKENATDTNPVTVYSHGEVDYPITGRIGAPVYLSTTDGELTTATGGVKVGVITGPQKVTLYDFNTYVYAADNSPDLVQKLDYDGSVILTTPEFAGNMQVRASDLAHNIYTTHDDDTARKYDSAGNLMWSFDKSGIDGFTQAFYSAAVDTEGNSYWGSADHRVYKIDRDGNFVWRTAEQDEAVLCTAVDTSGYVYSGSSDPSSGTVGITVEKYNANDGSPVWSFTGHTARILRIAVDQAGNVYTVSEDNTARKIDSAGNEVWSHTEAGWVRGVAVDPEGSVYITSGSTVKKLDGTVATPTVTWTYTASAYTTDIFVDTYGYLYVKVGSGNVAKLDPGGNLIWSFDVDANTMVSTAPLYGAFPEEWE